MLNRLIEAALVVVLAAAAVGQLPRLVQTVRVAQLALSRGWWKFERGIS